MRDGDRDRVKEIVSPEEIILKMDRIRTMQMLDWQLKEHTRKVKASFPRFKFDLEYSMDYLLKHHFKRIQKIIYEEALKDLDKDIKHQGTFQILTQPYKTQEYLEKEKFTQSELEKDVMLQDSRPNMLINEHLDIFLKIDEITAEKFPERLKIFEQMANMDDLLYQTDDCIGITKKIGMIPAKINRRKELKDYDTLLNIQIKEKEQEVIQMNLNLFHDF
mmetsp:Transcript_32740/g.29023  ORF Transcript_32740/g.29023 Transcript_32740/m.29023 type:complete len:219 (+) Transcript_32740:405-1061(+)